MRGVGVGRAWAWGANVKAEAELALADSVGTNLATSFRRIENVTVTSPRRGVTMDYRVRRAIALAEECLQRGWTPARLAESVNLSPSRLHQLFKRETGMPPARYLRLLRMQSARELLETTHLSVKQVMARVGVTDESHFVRDFKKSYGLTPARYRERFQNGSQGEGARREVSSSPRTDAPPSYARQPAPTSSVTTWTPPLLLRRASHPRQLSEPTFESRKRRELLSLLRRRHAAFAELTTEATDTIVRDMPGDRAISYSPRASAPPRRPPPRRPPTRRKG
jgi:AraC-like DNA-binding protein